MTPRRPRSANSERRESSRRRPGLCCPCVCAPGKDQRSESHCPAAQATLLALQRRLRRSATCRRQCSPRSVALRANRCLKRAGAAMSYKRCVKKRLRHVDLCNPRAPGASQAAKPCHIIPSMSNILASRLRFAPDGWARGEREGYGGPCDVTSLSLSRASMRID